MRKKRFFDDRLKYLSFIQNTSEKRAISMQLAPHIASMPKNRTFLRILDAGTGDGTVKSNVIKTFHKYHPYTSLLITGKEISYEDLKNTLEKMPDRFVEHPNLLVTMTNVKFAELGHIENNNKIKNKKVKTYTLILKEDNSYDFHHQINKLNNFIKKYWGIEIDNKSRTSYAHPCIIRIYREDHKRYLEPFLDNDYENNNYDLIIASQAYRAASLVEVKVNNVIAPLMRLLNKSGRLLVTHSCGGDSVEKIIKIAWKDKDPFPNNAKDIIDYLKNNPVGENNNEWVEREQLLFRSTDFGDDKDRALQKTDGTWTYFASDVAYHKNKIDRKFDYLINILGADHAGYIKRISSSVEALSKTKGKLICKVSQLVKLIKDNKPFKMSKRKGDYITVDDLITEVGKDATRFIMLNRNSDVQLDFDFTKVKEKSKDNPLYYVQYCYARISSVFRHVNLDINKDLNINSYDFNYSDSEIKILKKISEWPKCIEISTTKLEPHRIATFLYELASEFHSYWNLGKDDESKRFINIQNKTSNDKLVLLKVVSNVIKSGMTIVGVDTPQKM